MKAYKITHFRVGNQEPWAGWRIAGMTEGIPDEAKEGYFKLQSSNSTSSTVNSFFESAPIIWELICEDKYVYYSKLTYGIRDQGIPGRQSMRADGIVVSSVENPDLYKCIGGLIELSKYNFENRLQIEEIYPKMIQNNESTINLNSSYIKTNLDSVEIEDCHINYQQLINKYFSDETVLVKLLKCIYWVITDRSASTLNLICDNADEDKKNIIFIIMSLLPYSLRKHLSFRTMYIKDGRSVKVVFSDWKNDVNKFFNVLTGENNIIVENKLDNRWDRYSFITYLIKNKEEYNYFNLLNEVMRKLGNVDSIDLNFIKVAHEIVMESSVDQKNVLSDLELLKKFQEFLILPYNNEIIDRLTAKYLKMIIERNISLNESIKDRLYAKVNVTQSEILKKVGYGYTAYLMVKSSNRQKEFVNLEKMMDDKDKFNMMLSILLSLDNGKEFADEFYGTYYGDNNISDYKSLDSFIQLTKSLPLKEKIGIKIIEKCEQLGQQLINKYFSSDFELSSKFKFYTEYITKILYPNEKLANDIINDTKFYFWENFNFENFNFKNKNDYLIMEFKLNSKYQLVLELLKCFDMVKKCDEKCVKTFYYTINHSSYNLYDKGKEIVIHEFQSYCLDNVSKDEDIDFWCQVAGLIQKKYVDFIIENDVEVFTLPEILNEELRKSYVLKKLSFLESIILLFEEYDGKESDKACNILKELYQFRKERKKYEKEMNKKRKKVKEKQHSDDKIINREKNTSDNSIDFDISFQSNNDFFDKYSSLDDEVSSAEGKSLLNKIFKKRKSK